MSDATAHCLRNSYPTSPQQQPLALADPALGTSAISSHFAMSRALQAVLPKALLSHDRAEQLEALQALKNDIVGHVQKKEKWLEAGILEPIVKILNTASTSNTSRQRRSSLSVDDHVRLQSLQVLSSFAKGTCNRHLPRDKTLANSTCSQAASRF